MANRYWVGGTANWDGTAGTKWALTSGGAGGQAVPTSADDVFFDGASGANTVTIAATANAKSVTCTGFTGTLAGTSSLTVAGSVTFVAGMTLSYTGDLSITATGTVTSGGKSMPPLSINGAGITVTQGDAFTFASVAGASYLSLYQGTYTTNNNNITISGTNGTGLFITGTSTRTLTLGSSNVSITFSGASSNRFVDAITTTNLTLNANTSTITCVHNGTGTFSFWGGSRTYNNVVFTNSSTNADMASLAASSIVIYGTNTFSNLTFSGRTSAGYGAYLFNSNQTVTGTLTASAGTDASMRTFLASDTLGTARTLTCAAVSLTDADFRNITIAGAAAPVSGTRLGNCTGNTSITFPAAKTVYWNLAGSQNWSANGWATSSGGSPATTNFPLAQDTAVFDNTGSAGTVTINGQYNLGTIDMSARTSAMTLSLPSTTLLSLYADWKNGSGTTLSGSATAWFVGSNNSSITSSGKSFSSNNFYFQKTSSSSVTLQDAFTASSISHLLGTLNLNGFTLTCNSFGSSNSSARTLAFGTGNIVLTNTGGCWSTATVTNLTVTGTPVVNCTYSGAVAMQISTGALSEANSISFNFTGGTYSLQMLWTAGYTARNIDFTGFAGTWAATSTGTIYGDLKLSTGMTLTASSSAMTFGATSGTKTITSNGKTMDFPVTIDGAGGTFQLADNLTQGSTRAFTHTNGTVDLNGKTLTVGTQYVTAAGTKNLTFNGGTVVCPAASSTAWNNAQPTGFTTTAGTGTGKISMTAATAKTFVGGGSTYNCTLSNDGAGALTISGSNTFTTIANGVQPTTFTLTSGTTQTLTNWSVSGTSGNLVTIGATTTSAATLSKSSGTVSANYLSISYSTATGGASWYAGANSTNGGNNTGWIFTAAPVSNFFMLFN